MDPRKRQKDEKSQFSREHQNVAEHATLHFYSTEKKIQRRQNF